MQPKSFMSFSGVPDKYITAQTGRVFNQISKFLFVGLLLKRKHPFELVQALDRSEIKEYTLDIVGQGDEANAVGARVGGIPEAIGLENSFPQGTDLLRIFPIV